MKQNYPEKWTGLLIGKMHNNNISQNELAEELGFTKSYVSMVLRGFKRPDLAKTQFNEAVDRIIERRTEK